MLRQTTELKLRTDHLDIIAVWLELGTVHHQKRRHVSVSQDTSVFQLCPIDDCKVTEVLDIFAL